MVSKRVGFDSQHRLLIRRRGRRKSLTSLRNNTLRHGSIAESHALLMQLADIRVSETRSSRFESEVAHSSQALKVMQGPLKPQNTGQYRGGEYFRGWHNWLARPSDTREVGGSNPSLRTWVERGELSPCCCRRHKERHRASTGRVCIRRSSDCPADPSRRSAATGRRAALRKQMLEVRIL